MLRRKLVTGVPDDLSLAPARPTPCGYRLWKFVQFLMQDDNNLEFIKELGYLPAINSLKSDPYFSEPQRKPFVDMLPNAVYPQALANFDQVANAVLGVYQEAVVQDKYDAQTAVKNAAEKARAALK